MIPSLPMSLGVYELNQGAIAHAQAYKQMLKDSGVNASPKLVRERGSLTIAGGIPASIGFIPTTGTGLDFNVCPFTDPSQKPICDAKSPFRTIQGECNNLRQPFFGKSFTPLARLLDNMFDDGILEARSAAFNGGTLPSPRAISTAIRIPETSIESPFFTALFVPFAQFVDHDMDHVPVTCK